MGFRFCPIGSKLPQRGEDTDAAPSAAPYPQPPFLNLPRQGLLRWECALQRNSLLSPTFSELRPRRFCSDSTFPEWGENFAFPEQCSLFQLSPFYPSAPSPLPGNSLTPRFLYPPGGQQARNSRRAVRQLTYLRVPTATPNSTPMHLSLLLLQETLATQETFLQETLATHL